ncbi:MAG: lysozyme inhibitor LprI family protein [Syntrophobacteraceae bacterium]|nr:lysozyme inhibitor LprI family protein [Desulfobacteraceae bacterium]
MYRGIWVCIFTAALSLAAMNAARAAGFDCSKASTEAERLICSDQQLSALDDRLSEAWRQAWKKSADREALKKAQQEWIKNGRDVCQDVPCMQKAYETRIASLTNPEDQNSAQPQVQANTTPQEMLDEANRQFTFRKQPINPLSLKELYPWNSDKLPGPVAVDVEGTTANTSRYLAEVSIDARGFICAVQTDGAEKTTVCYKRLGTLANGVHVVQTWSSGSGTMVATDLILVKFMIDTEYPDGMKATGRNRLIMMRVGAFGLGDRYKGTVEVRPNEISIGAGGERKKTEVIRFK